jgi:hypothetical protein
MNGKTGQGSGLGLGAVSVLNFWVGWLVGRLYGCLVGLFFVRLYVFTHVKHGLKCLWGEFFSLLYMREETSWLIL